MNESIFYLQGSQDWDALAFPVRILEEKNSYGVRMCWTISQGQAYPGRWPRSF